ncbi:MAG: putative zinc-binding metallopeptidase [Planctomycetaceae bacterium]|nr:putative zinc-binding metallopeptidase [Planctomycetaceae bacterium]
MRTDSCQCGQVLFFENTQCVRCQSPVGWCDSCRRMVTLLPTINGGLLCHQPDCQATLALCENYAKNQVCNWTRPDSSGDVFCTSCQLTEIIPDLSQPEHHYRWARLEAAKRRLLYSLDLLHLPYRRDDSAANPPLRFRFLAPSQSKDTPVTTGHQNGCITLNLVEADDVEREKARVELEEPQRTLIGHFRHEIGHYYWDVFVAGQDEVERQFRDLFGDERSPTYQEALKQHYENGPPENWQEDYISAYATMHPWEDFAECFAGYLDMVSLLDTAQQHQLLERPNQHFPDMIQAYQRLAIGMNEMTRDRGLLDLIPEVISKKVGEKLAWIHQFVQVCESRAEKAQPMKLA